MWEGKLVQQLCGVHGRETKLPQGGNKSSRLASFIQILMCKPSILQFHVKGLCGGLWPPPKLHTLYHSPNICTVVKQTFCVNKRSRIFFQTFTSQCVIIKSLAERFQFSKHTNAERFPKFYLATSPPHPSSLMSHNGANAILPIKVS